MSVGVGAMTMPASRRAAILASAVPLPPEMIAPAWPIRRPGRCRRPGDEARHWLSHVLGHEGCGVLLGGPTDLADHDDAFGRRVVIEQPENIDEVGAVDRVATDADRGRLAKAESGQLIDGLIGQSAGAGDNADPTWLMDVAGHDPDPALLGE